MTYLIVGCCCHRKVVQSGKMATTWKCEILDICVINVRAQSENVGGHQLLQLPVRVVRMLVADSDMLLGMLRR